MLYAHREGGGGAYSPQQLKGDPVSCSDLQGVWGVVSSTRNKDNTTRLNKRQLLARSTPGHRNNLYS